MEPVSPGHPSKNGDQIYSVEVVVPERREQKIPSLPPMVQTYLRWRGEATPFSGLPR